MMLKPNRQKVVYKIFKDIYMEKLRNSYDVIIEFEGRDVDYITLITPKINGLMRDFLIKNEDDIQYIYDKFKRCVVPEVIKLRFYKEIETLVINLFCYYKNRQSRIERERMRVKKPRNLNKIFVV